MTGMINPLFLDFIRKQVAAGIPRPDIEKVLKTNGLSPEEIEEGFRAAVDNAPQREVQMNVPDDTHEAAQLTASTVTPEKRYEPPAIIGFDSTRNKTEAMSSWANAIPKLNRITMIACLALFIFVDTIILVDNPELIMFWVIMAGVMVLCTVFYYLENYVFAPRFAKTRARLDTFIFGLIAFRNLVFFLNVIPVIQVIGMWTIVFAGIPWLLAYGWSIHLRYRIR